MIELYGASILQLADLADDAKRLDEAGFAERHAPAFLLLQGGIEGLRTPSGPIKTVLLDSDTRNERRRPAMEFLVWPVRNAGRSPYQSFISIGRTGNNDIPIPDESISRVHALVMMGTDGKPRLRAMGGAQLPLVNGDEVPLAAGSGVALESGDSLSIGKVELTFLDAAAIVDLIQRSLK